MTASASEKASPSRKGWRFILSAPSGTGKTTLCRAILDRFPDIGYSISHTTRRPRPHEVNGEDYFFITTEAFHDKLNADRWAEWAEVHGNHYATSADFLESLEAAGRDVLLDIDVQGARQILSRYPERTVAIFILPPSMEVLKKRLSDRGSDSDADIEKRLRNAIREMAARDMYHHVIVNDHLPKAIGELTALIDAYRSEKPRADNATEIGKKTDEKRTSVRHSFGS